MKCYNCYNPHLDIHAGACDHCGALTDPPAVVYFVHPLVFVRLTLITLGLILPY